MLSYPAPRHNRLIDSYQLPIHFVSNFIVLNREKNQFCIHVPDYERVIFVAAIAATFSFEVKTVAVAYPTKPTSFHMPNERVTLDSLSAIRRLVELCIEGGARFGWGNGTVAGIRMRQTFSQIPCVFIDSRNVSNNISFHFRSQRRHRTCSAISAYRTEWKKTNA